MDEKPYSQLKLPQPQSRVELLLGPLFFLATLSLAGYLGFVNKNVFAILSLAALCTAVDLGLTVSFFLTGLACFMMPVSTVYGLLFAVSFALSFWISQTLGPLKILFEKPKAPLNDLTPIPKPRELEPKLDLERIQAEIHQEVVAHYKMSLQKRLSEKEKVHQEQIQRSHVHISQLQSQLRQLQEKASEKLAQPTTQRSLKHPSEPSSQALYWQLKEQYRDRNRALGEARKELFHTQETLLTYEQERKLDAADPNNELISLQKQWQELYHAYNEQIEENQLLKELLDKAYGSSHTSSSIC